MSTNSLEIVNEGWLTKSPPSKTLWRAKWRRRWFVLRDSGELPDQFVLEYFADRNCQKLKGHIDLDHCEQVDAGLTFRQGRHRFQHLFDLRTPKRVYYLAADTDLEMSKWVDCICQVCGLKAYTREDEYYDYVPSVDVSQQPVPDLTSISSVQAPSLIPLTTLGPLQYDTTPPHSPTESSVSGPYIPISECITGSSVFLNRNPNGESYDLPRQLKIKPERNSVTEESSNINISTPFVNWATYPGETVDSPQPFEAPPRPPKPPHLKIEENPSLTPPPISEITDDQYDFPRQHQTLERNKHCYSNAAPQTTLNGTIFLYDFPPNHRHDDTSSSLQSTPTASPSPCTPPEVNRQLKPIRKGSEGTTSSPKEWSTIGSSQTLPPNWPRPKNFIPPSVDRTLKPYKNHSHETKGGDSRRKASSCMRAAPSPSLAQPPRRRRSDASTSEDERRSLDFLLHKSHPEIQYLDLDLDKEGITSTSTQSPKSPDHASVVITTSSSIVYRTVDFVKTEAFNRTKQEVEKGRQQAEA